MCGSVRGLRVEVEFGVGGGFGEGEGEDVVGGRGGDTEVTVVGRSVGRMEGNGGFDRSGRQSRCKGLILCVNTGI